MMVIELELVLRIEGCRKRPMQMWSKRLQRPHLKVIISIYLSGYESLYQSRQPNRCNTLKSIFQCIFSLSSKYQKRNNKGCND